MTWRGVKLRGRKCLATRAGYTLPETLIATGVIGISFLAIFGGFCSGFRIIEFSRENTRATQILEEKTEMLRLYNWDQVNTTGYIPSTFQSGFYGPATNTSGGIAYTGSVTITTPSISEAYSNNLRQIKIRKWR